MSAKIFPLEVFWIPTEGSVEGGVKMPQPLN